MKPLDKEIFDILNKYIDMDYVSYYKNIVGIEVARYADHLESYIKYLIELKEIGFYSIGYCDLMSEKYLCSISYCEGDLMITYYKDIDEFNSEKQRAIEFYKNN